jgi:2-polyprenyl-6-hydroxyphenyl methylase/3-demethylubiquinone-9 3-methyltransferase
MDWLGGYPFEVASPDAIFAFYHSRGFALEKLKTCGGGLGCNELVFTRTA